MSANSNQMVTGIKNPMRITRMVSVILNGVVLTKMAAANDNDVDAMADSLMINLSDTVQNNIHHHEVSHVHRDLRAEIGRRITLPKAI